MKKKTKTKKENLELDRMTDIVFSTTSSMFLNHFNYEISDFPKKNFERIMNDKKLSKEFTLFLLGEIRSLIFSPDYQKGVREFCMEKLKK